MKNNLSKITFLSIVRLLISVCILVLSILYFVGVWENAIDILMSLSAILFFLISIQQWKQNKFISILYLVCGFAIFLCAVDVFLIK